MLLNGISIYLDLDPEQTQESAAATQVKAFCTKTYWSDGSYLTFLSK